MKTAYSYQRWSTASQGSEGRDSKQRQTQSANEWLKNHGKGQYVLSDETFVDAGMSGFKGKNIELDEYGKAKGELARFIQCVEQGKIKRHSILLVDSFDRFSRLAPVKALTLFLNVIESGIGLVFTGSYEKRVINSELINKEGYILQFIIGEMIRSHSESAEKSRKIISAKMEKRNRMARGEIVSHNGIPKYFDFVPSADKIHGKYIHNEKTHHVRWIVDAFLKGKSLYAIADGLNQKEIKPFRYGNTWAGNSVSKILRNRILIGEYIGFKNYVPPIIAEDEFNRIQNILSKNKFNRGQRGNIPNIFKGICYCADCGKAMTVMAQYKDVITGKRYETPYRYLRCSQMGKHCHCKNRGSIRLKEMEIEFFMDFLFKTPTQLVNTGDNQELKQLNTEINTLQAKLNQLNSEIGAAMNLLSTVPLDELKEKLTKLNTERDTVKGRIDSLNIQIANVVDAPDTFGDLKALFSPNNHIRRHEDMTEKDWAKHKKMFAAIENIIDSLDDSFIREGIRIKLPSLIGKITVDTHTGKFFVFNRMGNMVFESGGQVSNRNNTVEWQESLKNYTTRKLSNGRIVKLNRRINPSDRS